MKIVFLGSINSFNYHTIGGVENYIRRLSNSLIENDINIDYVYYDSDRSHIESINKSWNIYHYNTITRNDFNILLSGLFTKYDVIVPIYISNKFRLSFLFKSIIDNNKKVNRILFNWPTNILKRFLYFFEAKIVASKVICISNRQLNYLDSNLNISRKKLFIDRPIVPNSFYSNLEYKINKFNTQKIEVVFIGRLDKGKGIDDVISIMNKLIQDSRFSCKIYGIYFPDDEYGKKIHNYLENQKVIKYTAISRESYSVQIEDKTASIFKSCDIFLQPYRNISSTVDAPLLIYEAMAALTVIISRNVGELSNIIGSDKFLFDNKDNDSFVKSSIESIKKITVNIYSEELKRLDKRNCELNINKDDIWIV